MDGQDRIALSQLQENRRLTVELHLQDLTTREIARHPRVERTQGPQSPVSWAQGSAEVIARHRDRVPTMNLRDDDLRALCAEVGSEDRAVRVSLRCRVDASALERR